MSQKHDRRTLLAYAATAAVALALGEPAETSAQEPRKPKMTSKPPAELQALIDTHIKSFNSQNREAFLGVFGDTAVIIDGIAPYTWINPNAPAHWLNDVEKWRKANGVTEEYFTYELGFWNVEGDYAYAVISGILTVVLNGQSVVRTGTLAYTFAKHGAAWKIEAQAWGRTA